MDPIDKLRAGEELTDDDRELIAARHRQWLQTPDGIDAAEWALRVAAERRRQQAS